MSDSSRAPVFRKWAPRWSASTRTPRKSNSSRTGEFRSTSPGLDAIVQKNMQSGRLSFETDLASCMDGIEIVFIAVGTPPDENGDADLRYVFEVARTFGSAVKEYALLVTKSTVPVGTSRRIQQVVRQELARREPRSNSTWLPIPSF